MKKLSLLVLFICFGFSGFAKHITGGEMIYDLVSSNATSRTFKITLILFRDENCPGNCAPMPASVSIGVYNNDNSELLGGDYNIVNLSTTEILPITNIPLCLTNAVTLNYKAGYYPFTITLPNNNNGFTAVYQTCCRITSINNIINGVDGAGATYLTNIPGTNLVGSVPNDNSPRFSKGISIVCYDHEFTLDFSATDPDGDSLVYSMCDGYDGGAAVNSSYATPAAPPYASLIYTNGFTGIGPLGNNPIINTRTGIITGIAPSSGKYVVSVCVSSYRNGLFISTHRKDFIITVADCDFASAELLPEYITCDGFTYNFSNQSQSPLNQSFYWDFGDPASGTNDTSTLATPVHNFTAAGDYTVKFVVNRGTSCADSAFTTIRVYPGYIPDFNSSSPICVGVPLQFNDNTTANYGTVNSWHWDFGVNNINNDTSIISSPQYAYSQAGTYFTTLIVGSDKGCIDTVKKEITVVDKPTLSTTNDTLICFRDFLTLHASSINTGIYSWTPPYNITNSNTATPVVSPRIDTVYQVTFIDNFRCTVIDSVRISVVDSVTLKAGNDTTICKTDGVILNLISNATQYSWTPALTLDNPSIKNPIATPTSANTVYYVTGTIGNCSDKDSIKIKTINYPAAYAGADTLICWGSSANLNASGGSSYIWSPTIYLNNPLIANPISINPTANYIDYIVSIGDTLGCPKRVKDSIRVNIEHVIADAGPRDTSVVAGQALQLNATGSSIYSWSPSQWLNNSGIYNPISTPSNDIEYIVTVKNSVGCEDVDTISIHYYKVIPGFFLPNAFSPNGDGLNEVFTPIALGLKSVDLFMIYNRWGQLLFRTNQIGVGWDGKYKGSVQDIGTYVWYAEGTDYTNKKIAKKGTVVLIR